MMEIVKSHGTCLQAKHCVQKSYDSDVDAYILYRCMYVSVNIVQRAIEHPRLPRYNVIRYVFPFCSLYDLMKTEQKSRRKKASNESFNRSNLEKDEHEYNFLPQP
jgi:hypothetical protein